MNIETLERFKEYFSQLDGSKTQELYHIYSDLVHFKDPVHEIRGVTKLAQYFQKLNENLLQGAFVFTDQAILGNKVYLSWTMNLHLRKPSKHVKASGISVLVIEDKVISHTDYFDAGEVFYENIPVIGVLIKMIKRKLQRLK